MRTLRTVLLALGFTVLACGGSEKEAKDPSQYDPEEVSEEQHQNEVDPFFEGEGAKRGTEKVDLADETESEGGGEDQE